MLCKQKLQLPVFICEGFSIACNFAEVLFKLEYFLFKSFDVELLSFAVRPRDL